MLALCLHSAPAQTNVLYVNVGGNFGLQYTNWPVKWTPVLIPRQPGSLIPNVAYTALTDSNAVAWFTNVCAGSYTVTISAGRNATAPTTWTLTVLTNTLGTVDATTLPYIATAFPTNYYTAAQINALLASGGNSSINTALPTNGSSPAIVGQTIYIPTNYDAAGAAGTVYSQILSLAAGGAWVFNAQSATGYPYANLVGAPASGITNNQTGVSLTGTFSGNGAGLTNIAASVPPGVLTNNQTGVTLTGTFNTPQYDPLGAATAVTNGFPWSSLYDTAGAASAMSNGVIARITGSNYVNSAQVAAQIGGSNLVSAADGRVVNALTNASAFDVAGAAITATANLLATNGNGSGLTNLAPTIVTATNFVYAPGGGSNAVQMTVLAFTNGIGQVTYSVQDDDRSLPITNDDRAMSMTNGANNIWGTFKGLGASLTNSNGSGFTSDIDGSALTHTNPNNIFSGNSASISNVVILNSLILTNSTGLIQISNSAAGFLLMSNTPLTSSNLNVRGTMAVSGNSTLTGTVSVGGATTITGASTLTGAVTMSAAATWVTTLNGAVATSTSSCSNYVGTNGIFQRLTLGQYVFPFTNVVIVDGLRGCSFLYTNTTNPLIFFTNINIGTEYSLMVVQTNSGASGGPWNFTNWQGGNNNSFVCWPGTNIMNPATNFGARSLYRFTAFAGYGTLGTNIIMTSAITNF